MSSYILIPCCIVLYYFRMSLCWSVFTPILFCFVNDFLGYLFTFIGVRIYLLIRLCSVRLTITYTTGNITGARTAYHDRQHYWSKNCLPRQATLLEQELLTTTGNITGARTAYHDRQHYRSKNCLPRQAILLKQELLTTTGNTTGARTAYPSGTPDFTTGFSEVTVDNFFIFYVMFCQLLFFVLTIFFWSLYYLSVFHLRLIISPLVFSYFFSSTLFDILSTIFILYKCMFVECAM